MINLKNAKLMTIDYQNNEISTALDYIDMFSNKPTHDISSFISLRFKAEIDKNHYIEDAINFPENIKPLYIEPLKQLHNAKCEITIYFIDNMKYKILSSKTKEDEEESVLNSVFNIDSSTDESDEDVVIGAWYPFEYESENYVSIEIFESISRWSQIKDILQISNNSPSYFNAELVFNHENPVNGFVKSYSLSHIF